jgi:hypothetical protein
MRCSKCSESCGDDFKTRTKYREEKNAGDCLKVILLQIYDLVFIHNLQVAEVIALILCLVKEHVVEEDELSVKKKEKKS